MIILCFLRRYHPTHDWNILFNKVSFHEWNKATMARFYAPNWNDKFDVIQMSSDNYRVFIKRDILTFGQLVLQTLCSKTYHYIHILKSRSNLMPKTKQIPVIFFSQRCNRKIAKVTFLSCYEKKTKKKRVTMYPNLINGWLAGVALKKAVCYIKAIGLFTDWQ